MGYCSHAGPVDAGWMLPLNQTFRARREYEVVVTREGEMVQKSEWK